MLRCRLAWAASAEAPAPAPNADPAVDADPELGAEPSADPALVLVVVVVVLVLVPAVGSVLVEPPAHEASCPTSALVPGVVVTGLVVVLGAVLVESVDEVVVPVSALSVVVVEAGVVLAGMLLSELAAGQGVVPVVPVVVVAGVVADPFSTVESVWVWVRPVGAIGVVFALVVAGLPCLPRASGLCGVVAVALAGAALCGCLTAV